MNERKPIDATAFLLMVVLCGLWGTQQVAIKIVAADMSPVLQVGVRFGVASFLILLFVVLRRDGAALGGVNWRPGVVAGALFGLEFVLIGEGLRFTSASHMSIFLYTAPIFASLGLHLRMPEERLGPLQWAGVGLAFVGVAVSLGGRDGAGVGTSVWLGDLLGLAAGAVWGATTLVVRASRLARAPATVTLWYQLTGACLLGIGSAVVLGQTTVRITPALLASLAYQSVPIAAGSYLVWFTLLRTYLASRLGVLSFMTPVFGIAFGVLILNDRLTVNFLIGALLILFGILLVSGQDLVTRRRVGTAGSRVGGLSGVEPEGRIEAAPSRARERA